MAVVKPLIRYADTGQIEEVRAADTIQGAVAGKTFAFFVS